MSSMPRSIVVSLVLAAGLFAQPNVEFEHYQLPNGMHVILHQDHAAPLVHLNLRFFVGSKHEAPGRTGFAHLFEHLMGENADAAGGYVMVAEAIGATDINAHTYADSTEYHETVPASRLERMLWLESNQWASLPQRLTQESFAREREIVINERRQRIDNEPYAIANSLVHRLVFPPGHPYSHDVIGTPADLMAASLDDVRAFYRDYYTPDNASLVVSGDFDPVQTKAWIAKCFGSFAPGDGIISPAISAAPMTAPQMVEVTAVVPYTRIQFAWAAPGVTAADRAPLEFAQFILDERWHEKAFRDRIQFDPGATYYQLEDASVFAVVGTTNGKIPIERVRSVMTEEIGRFAREGPTSEEIERARNDLELGQISSLEDLHGVSFELNEVQQYYGIEHFNDWATRYKNVTADSVRKAVSRWLLTPNALTIKFTPITARRDSTPELDRKTPPPFQPEKPFHLPEIKSARLPTGLRIFVVERHNLPKVTVELRLNLGSAHAPAGKPALAMVTMLTFASGTPTRTAEEIKKTISSLAASLTANADPGSQYISFEALRKNMEPMLELLSDALLHPVYPKDVFETRKSDVIEDFQRHEGRIDEYGGAISAIAFGPAHPLGASSSNPEAIRGITAADVQDFRNRFWHPDAAVIVFAGDITLGEAVAAATHYLGEWKGSAESPGKLPPPAAMKGHTFLVERKGVTQTSVVMILPGITENNPDYPALTLVNSILGGGGFFSRLYRSIRLDRGIAYGVNSDLMIVPEHGLWIASSPVEAGKTREAVAAFLEELRGMAGARPITRAELEAAKQHLIRWWPEQFQGNGSTAATIAESWVQDQSLNDLKTYEERIAAVTLDQVNVAARKYAQPDQAVFLLVGDPDKIGAIDGLVVIK